MGAAASLTARPPASTLCVDVEQRFGSGFGLRAVLDVELRPGAILVLFGPSGAGKTTILRHIAGLERPDTGTVRVDGEVWCDTRRGVWRSPQERRVGIVFQEPTLFPHLTVRENIRYGVRPQGDRKSVPFAVRPQGHADPSNLGSDPRARGSDPIAGITRMIGVGHLENRYPRQLSGGEAQRVALARALAPQPRLLLLDEPFAALDAPTRGRLRHDVRALLQRTGTPAILVTHDRSEALTMGDSMAVAIGGRIRQQGSLSAVFGHPADADVAASLGVEAVLPARIASSWDGLLAVTVAGIILHVAERAGAAGPMTAGTDVYACIRAEDVTLETQSPAHASTRNHLAARVVSMLSEGPIERVTLDCGFPLDALITRRSREEMDLRVGDRVTAAIKATSIHLEPRA
jgi:molybdate transport system ATP-binding protein